ncbi:hypothetical protein JCM14036_27430 [Desulfotomaculum defluvii]
MTKEIHHILKPYHLSLDINDTSPLDLFNRQGQLVLLKGEKVTSEIKDMFQNKELYVLHGEWKEFQSKVCHLPYIKQGMDYEDTPENLLASSAQRMRDLYWEAKLVNRQHLEDANNVVDDVRGCIRSHPKLRMYFDMLHEHDPYTYVHSINVALLSVLVGLEMGYNRQGLADLATGALLHDLGKLLIPKDILNKPGSLTPREFTIIKNHPLIGMNIIMPLVDSREFVTTVRQHHERWDGKGYPDGIKGDEIHPNAQIIAVADVFDALTTDRPYRPGFPPYHAVEIIMKGEGQEFSPRVVQAFLKTVVLYPENTRVTLNTGEVGMVVGVPTRSPTRPRIKVIYSPYEQNSEYEQIIDLQQNNGCIVSTVKYGGVRMKFMLIDDDRDCLDGLVSALEPTGHELNVFTVPEEAVKAYLGNSYDVVITDMKMPGMTGIEVLKAIRKLDQNAKVILITGYGDVETAIAAVNNGAYAFFGKPVVIEELLETIEKISDEAEIRKQTKEEQERMAKEYSKLKRAYEELQELLREKDV